MIIIQTYTYDGSNTQIFELFNGRNEYVTRINIPQNKIEKQDFSIDFSGGVGPTFKIPLIPDFQDDTKWIAGHLFCKLCYDTTLQAIFIQNYIETNLIVWLHNKADNINLFSLDISKRSNIYQTGKQANSLFKLPKDDFFIKKETLLATKVADPAFLNKYGPKDYVLWKDIVYKEPDKVYGFLLLNILASGASGTVKDSCLIPVKDNYIPTSLIDKKLQDLPSLTKNTIQIFYRSDGFYFVQSRLSQVKVFYTKLFTEDNRTEATVGNSWYWLLDNYNIAKKMTGVPYGNRYGIEFDGGSSVQYDSTQTYNWFNAFIVRDANGLILDELVYTGSEYYSKVHNKTIYGITKADIKILWNSHNCVIFFYDSKIAIIQSANKFTTLLYTSQTTLPGAKLHLNLQKQISNSGEILTIWQLGRKILFKFYKLTVSIGTSIAASIVDGDEFIHEFSSEPKTISNIEPNAYGQDNPMSFADFWSVTLVTSAGEFYLITINYDHLFTVTMISDMTTVGDINLSCNFILRENLHSTDIDFLRSKGLLDL